MHKIQVGQELEFIEPAHVDDRLIEKGTRVRVGYVEDEALESNVMVVVLGTEPVQTLTLPRHILTLHCRPVQPAG
jgi:hypothetical protein